MKSLYSILIFISLNNLFLIAVYAQGPIIVGYNQDLVPSFYWKNKNENQGIDAEIIERLFQRSNLSYKIWFVPWKRLMHLLKTGEIDSACPGFKTNKREIFAHYLEMPLNYAVFSVFVRRDETFPFSKLEDLYGRVIGINRGYSISPHINDSKHRDKIIIEEANSAENNLRKLIIKRLDAYVGNRDAVLFTALKMGISEKIVYLPHPIFEPRPVYFMISKSAIIENKSSVIEKLNTNLNQMWKDGIIEQIIFKYVDHKSYISK